MEIIEGIATEGKDRSAAHAGGGVLWRGLSHAHMLGHSLVGSGVRLAFSSDPSVETLDVLAGFYAAVTRTRRVADFVALSRDSLTVPPDELPEIMAIMTVVDGTVRYVASSGSDVSNSSSPSSGGASDS